MLKNFNTKDEGLAAYYLTDTEKRITEELGKQSGGLTIKELAENTRKTRLTLLHSLNKLLRRGFVSKDETAKAHVWKWKNPIVCTSPSVREMKVEEAYEFLSRNIRDKVYAIQGSKTIKDEIDGWKNKTRSIRKANVSQKLKTTIIDGVLSEDVLPLLKDLPKEIKKSHYGRATIAHTVPPGNLDTPYELFFCKEYVCCMYPKGDYAIIIRHKPLSRFLIALYQLLSSHATKINLGGIYK